MMKRRLLFALVALVATTTLSACVPGAGAGPSQPPTESSGATPTPSPEPAAEPAAASVTVSAEAITVLDAGGGALASFDYFQPADEVVAGISGLLGASVDSPYPGGTEQPPGVQHDWGGLRMVDSDAPVSEPYYPEYWVIVTTGDANGVPIGTPPGVGSEGGLHVGGAMSGVTIVDEPVVTSSESSDGRPIAYVRVGLVPLPPGGEYGEAPNVGVTVVGHTDSDTIDRFIAPARNWGA